MSVRRDEVEGVYTDVCVCECVMHCIRCSACVWGVCTKRSVILFVYIVYQCVVCPTPYPTQHVYLSMSFCMSNAVSL